MSTLDSLATGDPVADMRALFSWSYRALDREAARLFRLIGLHPGPDLTASAAASLVALPIPQARRLLTELCRANLIHEHRHGRYLLHDLLRAYALELSEQDRSAMPRCAGCSTTTRTPRSPPRSGSTHSGIRSAHPPSNRA